MGKDLQLNPFGKRSPQRPHGFEERASTAGLGLNAGTVVLSIPGDLEIVLFWISLVAMAWPLLLRQNLSVENCLRQHHDLVCVLSRCRDFRQTKAKHQEDVRLPKFTLKHMQSIHLDHIVPIIVPKNVRFPLWIVRSLQFGPLPRFPHGSLGWRQNWGEGHPKPWKLKQISSSGRLAVMLTSPHHSLFSKSLPSRLFLGALICLGLLPLPFYQGTFATAAHRAESRRHSGLHSLPRMSGPNADQDFVTTYSIRRQTNSSVWSSGSSRSRLLCRIQQELDSMTRLMNWSVTRLDLPRTRSFH